MTGSQQHPAIEQRYQPLFTHHPDGVCELDLEGNFLRCNEALEAISGYSEAQLLGRPFSEIIHEQAREYSLACFRAAAVGEVQHHENLGSQPSGKLYSLEISHVPIVVEAEVVGVYGICRDITLHKQQQTDLRVKKRSLEASRNGVLIADALQPDMPIVYVNPAFLEITGYGPDEVLGYNCRFLQGPKTDPEAAQVIRDAIERQEEVRLTLLNYRKDGTEFLNYLTLAPVFDDEQRCTHYVGVQDDITRQHRNEQQLAHHSTHDLLTGLPNRELFISRLAYDYQVSLQSEKLLALFYINLDDFKTINSGLGHEVADKLLTATAERLKTLIEPGETLARLDGDEFALMIPGIDDEGSAIRMAEGVLHAVSRPFKIDDQWLHISASIGIASSGEPVKQASDMLRYGEIAMQGAKLQGRNTWQWYGELRSDVAPGELVMLRREIQQALDEQQFELHYQPIVDTLTGQVRSV
ncbi:MAG: PAS domain S-box protein, partial [Halomonas sp.]|nr:PAS domain S-box protein [Halomonas sp.]